MYYNTTKQIGARLAEYQEKAACQEAMICDHFMHHGGEWSPSEIHRAVLPFAPLTSVRRAMTSMSNAGVLSKTGNQKEGPFGRPEGTWKMPERVRRIAGKEAPRPPVEVQAELF